MECWTPATTLVREHSSAVERCGPHVAISPAVLQSSNLLEPRYDSGACWADIQGYTTLMMLLSFMVGCCCLTMGLFRLGFVVNFVSRPVLSGFASASAVLTTVSMTKEIMGVSIKKSPYLYVTIPALVAEANETHGATVAVGLSMLFIMWLWKKFVVQYCRAAGTYIYMHNSPAAVHSYRNSFVAYCFRMK